MLHPLPNRRQSQKFPPIGIKSSTPSRTTLKPSRRDWSSTTATSTRAQDSTANPRCDGWSCARGVSLQIHRLPSEYFGEGITILGDKIYQLTWQNGVCFVYDRRTFRQITQFRYYGEGWGLTNDGKHLIMSDGSETITFRDPDTFAEVRKITVRAQGKPVKNLNELEFIDGEIWANLWYSDMIVRIDPSTGVVKAWVDMEGLPVKNRDIEAVMNGIAYDRQNKRIFVTGKNWDKLFEIELVPPRSATPSKDDATR
jgi:glutaminyl-peptide cyclotransferase